MASNGLDSYAYRKARRELRAQWQAEDAKCWLCNMPIDYTIKAGDPEALEADHVYPRSTHGHLDVADKAGLRPSHKSCNTKRSNKMPEAPLGKLTRRWLK